MKPFFLALSIAALASVINAPNAAQQNVCSKDIDGKEVNIKVVNKTNKPFTVNWVDQQCKEGKPDQQVAPGETFEGISYNGHAFRVREVGTNRLLQVIVVNPSKPLTIVNAPPAAAAGGQRPAPVSPGVAPTAVSPTSPAGATIIKVFIDKPKAKPCAPEPGWAKCLELLDPTIKIMATKAVSQSALNGVANVYTEMTSRFGSKYPRSKLNNFKVYMTNDEPWSELANLSPIGNAYPAQPYQNSGDFLRGYGNPTNLWITEQMICKQGVKTRNDTGKIKDDTPRTFDQVVHEFAHSIHSNYLSDQTVNLFRFQKMTPLESFPYRVQMWFGALPFDEPAPANQEVILKDLFTSRATSSCEGYRP